MDTIYVNRFALTAIAHLAKAFVELADQAVLEPAAAAAAQRNKHLVHMPGLRQRDVMKIGMRPDQLAALLDLADLAMQHDATGDTRAADHAVVTMVREQLAHADAMFG